MTSVRTAVPMTFLILSALGGCASSMSGLGGSERLSCKAPDGVICTSVSGVYGNAANIAAKSAPVAMPAVTAPYGANAVAPGKHDPASHTSDMMRSSPRVLRLWIAPWEDGDGDLHEEATVHVLVDNGRWLIDHVRARPRSRLDATAPPLPVPGGNPPPRPATETPARSESLPMPPGLPPALNTLPR